MQARSLSEPKADALTQPPADGALMASYSVFVVEPGSLPGTFIAKVSRSVTEGRTILLSTIYVSAYLGYRTKHIDLFKVSFRQ